MRTFANTCLDPATPRPARFNPGRLRGLQPFLPLAVILLCGTVVAGTVVTLSWLLKRVHTEGAKDFCNLWARRVASRLSALQPKPSLVSAARALQIQSEYHSYLLEQAGPRPRTLAQLRTELQLAYDDVAKVEDGLDPFAGRTGTFLRGHASPIDGTLQPYSISVPKRYASAPSVPLLIDLHGHGWYRPFQGHPAPSLPGAIVLSPHGRGSTDYMHLGEHDVLMALEDVRRNYRIDADHVYVAGGSMGGTGSWHLGVRYPDLFAGIGPVAGNADHHVWEALWGWQRRTSGPFAGLKRFLADGLSPITFAENLLNVPVFCIHGEADDVVPVQHARNMVERVKAAGGEVVYHEVPEGGHGDVPGELLNQRLLWLGHKQRKAFPLHVRYKTNRRRYAGAYWVRILDLRREVEFASLDAKVNRPGRVVVQTQNVQTLGLYLPRTLVGHVAHARVTIDGSPPISCQPQETEFVWFSFDEPRQAWVQGRHFTGRKTAAVEGPMEHVFTTPFVVVYGTRSDDPFEAIRQEALNFVRQWQKRYGKPCRIKADVDVTEDEARLLSLVLYGGPWANLWTHKLMDRLPVDITREAITFNQERHVGPDVGVKLCYPSPLNPSRYVALVAATTSRGMFQANNRFGNWFDWGTYDNRNWFDFAIFDSRTWSPETFRVVGFFDRHWQTAADLTWRGDAEIRQKQLPFRVPPRQSGPTPGAHVYLSDLWPAEIDQDKGPVSFDRTWDGRSIEIAGQDYAKGLGVKAPSCVDFELRGSFKRFQCVVGIDYSDREPLTPCRMDAEVLEFEVYGDGEYLASSGPLHIGRPAAELTADVTGVRRLSLRVSTWTGARWLLGSAVWADAKVANTPPQ